MPRDATRRGDECVVVVAVASARSSTLGEVAGPSRLALVLDVACSPALTPRRSMFAIVSFEGVLNFTAEGRLSLLPHRSASARWHLATFDIYAVSESRPSQRRTIWTIRHCRCSST